MKKKILSALVGRVLRQMIPNAGSLIVMTVMLVAYHVWAAPKASPAAQGLSPGILSYQGYLTDADGGPINGTVDITFRLYDVPEGGIPLWEEAHTGDSAVPVEEGVFNVMLGSLNPIPDSVWESNPLYLGIQVGNDPEMAPRARIGGVPLAGLALTVPDGSITTEKIADGAVTSAKLHLNDSVMTNGNLLVTGKELTWTLDHWGKWLLLGQKPVTGNRGGHNLSEGFGVTVQWDSDYAFVGLENRGHDRKDAIIMWGDNSDDRLRFLFGEHGSSSPRETMILDARGNLWVRGELRADGAKPAVVQTLSFGQRKLYAAESPEVRFFDEGLARLHDGVARVELDPIFLETIEGDYLVHVTPYGDASLYVAEIGKDYFVVKAREGDPNVTFAWRLSAIRKGYAGVRLEEVK